MSTEAKSCCGGQRLIVHLFILNYLHKPPNEHNTLLITHALHFSHPVLRIQVEKNLNISAAVCFTDLPGITDLNRFSVMGDGPDGS